MQKHTTQKDDGTPYVKPVLADAGHLLQLTKGGSGNEEEGRNIVWGLFCSLPLRPRD